MNENKKKVAIVTGAAKNIGRATCKSCVFDTIRDEQRDHVQTE